MMLIEKTTATILHYANYYHNTSARETSSPSRHGTSHVQYFRKYYNQVSSQKFAKISKNHNFKDIGLLESSRIFVDVKSTKTCQILL